MKETGQDTNFEKSQYQVKTSAPSRFGEELTCTIFYVQVFSPTELPQHVDSIASQPVPKRRNPIKCLLQEHNKQCYWHKFHKIFMLSAKQESCEYSKTTIYRYCYCSFEPELYNSGTFIFLRNRF